MVIRLCGSEVEVEVKAEVKVKAEIKVKGLTGCPERSKGRPLGDLSMGSQRIIQITEDI